MKGIVFLLALLLLPGAGRCFAQSATDGIPMSGSQYVYMVKGTVIDTNAQAVAGAMVFLPGIARGTVTNSDGTFELGAPYAGKFTLRVMYAAMGRRMYGPADISVDLQALQPVDVRITLSNALEKGSCNPLNPTQPALNAGTFTFQVNTQAAPHQPYIPSDKDALMK